MKVILLASYAFFFTLVVFNNLVDYQSNFEFVTHVLSMDSLFSAEAQSWRSLKSPFFHHAFYLLIIFVEAAIAFLSWRGVRRMIKKSSLTFTDGPLLGMILAVFVFMSMGGEWFLMWQSKDWNGLNAALRLMTMSGFCYLILEPKKS